MKPLNLRKAAFARLLTPVWWALGYCFRKSSEPQPPNSILILDFHLIGDIVLLTPLLRVVRQAYPDAHLVLVSGSWANEILRGTEWVDEIIPFAAPWVKYGQGWRGWLRCIKLALLLRKRNWDLGIEVRGDVRQILLLAFAGACRRVGYDFTGGGALLTDVVPDDGRQVHLADHHRRIAEYLQIWPSAFEYMPELTLTEEEKAKALRRASYCGFHLGASLPLRRLSRSEAVDLVYHVAENQNKPILLFVSPDDPNSAQELYDALPLNIQLRTELWKGGLREMMVTLSCADRLYCMDSGSAHIAAALGVPVTVIYGPAVSKYVKPIGASVTVVERNDLSCKPCDQRHCINEIYQCCLKNIVTAIDIL